MPVAKLANNDIIASILTLRSHRVIPASDLAKLYGVETKRLDERVRRNPERFPPAAASRKTSPQDRFPRA